MENQLIALNRKMVAQKKTTVPTSILNPLNNPRGIWRRLTLLITVEMAKQMTAIAVITSPRPNTPHGG